MFQARRKQLLPLYLPRFLHSSPLSVFPPLPSVGCIVEKLAPGPFFLSPTLTTTARSWAACTRGTAGDVPLAKKVTAGSPAIEEATDRLRWRTKMNEGDENRTARPAGGMNGWRASPASQGYHSFLSVGRQPVVARPLELDHQTGDRRVDLARGDADLADPLAVAS